MKEIDRKTDFGSNVESVIEKDGCRVMRMSSSDGDGIMTLYSVFPGAYVMYNDFHMSECVSGFESGGNLLCIDHCREGRIETEIMEGTYSYLSSGDMRVDSRIHHNGKVFFPQKHYHGVTIGFDLDVAEKELKEQIKDFPVSLKDILGKYCTDDIPYVITGAPEIEHIFSEIYSVPSGIRTEYYRIKILELLLFLDALTLADHKEERPYFYKGQVEKIKSIHKLMTDDLTRNYTIEELSKRFEIAPTMLKTVFKNIYGSPIFTYMKNYRMNVAAGLLKNGKDLKVADIAGLVGYDSPSKFASAFKKEMGRTPLEYRKYFGMTETVENEDEE